MTNVLRLNGKSTTRKGLSDLISIVLLIAFTLAVAFILGAWFSGLSRGINDKNSESLSNVKCSYTNFHAYDFSYQNGSNATFNFKIFNKGNNELYNFAIFTSGLGSSELIIINNPTRNDSLKPGQIIEMTGFGNINTTSFRIFSRSCPAQYEDIEP